MGTREEAMKYRTQKWFGIIRECQASGLKKRTWCRQNDISEKAFYYWLRKFRKMACENKELMQEANGIESSDVIHPIVPITVLKDDTAVKQKDASHQNSCIILNINSIEVKIYNGTSAGLIENTVRALKNIC